jgi:putative toxin-antitoxin system antitoxin component (TIGR02293 family)
MASGASITASASVQPASALAASSEDSLYARIGVLLGLDKGMNSEVDLIDRLEKGLTVGAVQALRSGVGLTDEETFQLIAPRRTLSRRETLGQALSREEADKAVRVARVAAHAQQAFRGRPAYTAEWLRTPIADLGGRTPMQALVTESGALAVTELLAGIEYGLFG